jgi:hypothetical protein
MTATATAVANNMNTAEMEEEEKVPIDAIACQLLQEDFHFFCGSCLDLNTVKTPESFDEVVTEVYQMADTCPPSAEVEQISQNDCQSNLEKLHADYDDYYYDDSNSNSNSNSNCIDNTHCHTLNRFQYQETSAIGECKDEDYHQQHQQQPQEQQEQQEQQQQQNFQRRNSDIMEEDDLMSDSDLNLDMLDTTEHDNNGGESKHSETPERKKSERKSRLDDKTLDALSQMLSAIPGDLVKAQTFAAAGTPMSRSKQLLNQHHPKSARVKRRYPKEKPRDDNNADTVKDEQSKDDSKLNNSALMEELSILPLTGRKQLHKSSSIDDSFDLALEMFDFNKLANDLSNSEFVKTISTTNVWTPPAWSKDTSNNNDDKNPAEEEEDNRGMPTTKASLRQHQQHHPKVRFRHDSDKTVPEYPSVINVKNRPRSFPARPRAYYSQHDAVSVDTHPDDETAGGANPTFSTEKDKKRFWRLQLARKIIGRRSKSMFHTSSSYSNKKNGKGRRGDGTAQEDVVTVEEDGSIQVSLHL